jgi:RNA polymerase sigma-70 factor (ECF subfamily)
VDWSNISADRLMQSCTQLGSIDAWAEFIRRYHSVLTSAAVRVSRRWGCGTSDEIDDVVQEIYLRLCADAASILATFRDPRADAIFGFLKVVSTNIAHDYFRRRSALKRGTRIAVNVKNIDSLPAISSDAAWAILDRRLTLEEIDVMLLTYTTGEKGPRDRAVFNFYYRHGMTAQAIAELPGIGLTSKGVEAVLYRLIKAIRQGMTGVQEKSAD